jgi:hypothetical protein
MKEEHSKGYKESLSWEQFKSRYFAQIVQLAELLDLDVAEERNREIRFGSDLNESEIFDEWMFIDNVLTCIRDCENREEKIRVLTKLDETDGARDIFDEIYRIWTFEKYDYCSEDCHYSRRRLRLPERRSQLGEGDIVDIFKIDDCREAACCLSYVFGRDYAETQHDIVVKIKHNSRMTPEQIVNALEFAAKMYERRFTKRIKQEEGYLDWETQQYDAIRLGLYCASRSVYRDVEFNLYDMDVAFQLVGWIDPEVSLDTGLGEMLREGWPDLYEKVLEGNMTPFEAFLKTGWVNPKYIFDILGNSQEIQSLVKESFPPYQWIQRKRREDEQAHPESDLLQELENL